MPIEMSCPECGTSYRIPEAAAGKKVKCRSCGRAIEVPQTEGSDPWDDESTNESDEPETIPPRRTQRLPAARTREDAPRDRAPGKSPSRKRPAASEGPTWWIWLALGTVAVAILGFGVFLMMRSGGTAAPSDATIANDDEMGDSTAAADPFRASPEEAAEGDAPFLAASKPFLTAVAARDYNALFQTLSSHATASVQPHQFFPQPESAAAPPPLTNLTVEQFRDWMGQTEQHLGRPRTIDLLLVESHDPDVLAGKGDPLDVMLAIGAMPQSIPVNVRKASIRAQVLCDLSEMQAKQLATEQGVSEEEARRQFEAENKEAGSEGLYLNVKFVLVEEGGQLKVGYFEFMPPSMLD